MHVKRVRFQSVIICVCLFALSTSMFAQNKKPNPAFAKVTDDPQLPRVLLIGDSISIGYTVPLQKLLAGKANVHRIPVNGGPTTRGVQSIDKWLGDGHWDLIHFNWGLHDLKYCDDKGRLQPVDQGHQQVPLDEYRANLTKLVDRLQKTGAKLIWRNTTPVPEGSVGRVPGDAVKYNAVAREIMQARGIPIENQHFLVKTYPEVIMLPKNVHFTKKGYEALAEHAATTIEAQLKSTGSKTPGQP